MSTNHPPPDELPSIAPPAQAHEVTSSHPSRPTFTNLAVVAPATIVPPPRGASHPRSAVLGGAAVLAAVVIALGLWLPRLASSRSAEVASAAAPPPVIAARAPVRLSLSAQPPEALLLLDGKPLGARSFDGTFPRDDSSIHTLRIEAPGFLPSQSNIVFDRDRVIEVALTPSPAAPLAREPAPTPAPRGWSAPAPKPAPGKPLRPLDGTNPYAP